MRNVVRTEQPKSLERNSSRWTRELLTKIASGDKVPANLYNHYNKEDIKDALKSMYKDLCCYCESRINIVDFPHIEHLKPKNKFPEFTYVWSNLHLACARCNVSKSNKYNTRASILDPVSDIPISNHLEYELEWISPRTERGTTTVKHADLNRHVLREVRREVFDSAMKVILKIKGSPSDPANDVRKEQLELKCKEQFGTLIEDLMQKLLL